LQVQLVTSCSRGISKSAKSEGFGIPYTLTADFLIGPDQTILLAHYADFVSDHLPFEEIELYLGLRIK